MINKIKNIFKKKDEDVLLMAEQKSDMSILKGDMSDIDMSIIIGMKNGQVTGVSCSMFANTVISNKKIARCLRHATVFMRKK